MSTDNVSALGHFAIDCYDAQGNLKWSDEIFNTVTTQGKNFLLDTTFAGSAYTAAWYLSLTTAGTATTSSTYAVPIVTEVTSSNLAARVAITWTSASAGVKASNTVACSIIGTSVTITGMMIVQGGSGVTTTGNTAATGGVMYAGGVFSGGSKTVASGDTINCTYSTTIT